MQIRPGVVWPSPALSDHSPSLLHFAPPRPDLLPLRGTWSLPAFARCGRGCAGGRARDDEEGHVHRNVVHTGPGMYVCGSTVTVYVLVDRYVHTRCSCSVASRAAITVWLLERGWRIPAKTGASLPIPGAPSGEVAFSPAGSAFLFTFVSGPNGRSSHVAP